MGGEGTANEEAQQPPSTTRTPAVLGWQHFPATVNVDFL